MSRLVEYRAALELYASDTPFYGLIMAAMLRADSMNAAKLRDMFPVIYDELKTRYDAPGGLIDGDPGYAEVQAARARLEAGGTDGG